MSEQTYFQSHACEGYRAKVTIEWETPESVPLAERTMVAETIASDILVFSANRLRQMVQAMRGVKIGSESGS